jgi:fermentation-respiration switch protein FrsA (DUF1100 family)
MRFMKLFLILIILALGVWWLGRRFERRQMYFPDRVLEFTPAEINLSYRDIYLSTPDRIRIHAWWIPAEEARGSLIFCHGNAGNISHRLESIRIFNELGLNVLIFDYRGYGKSKGSPAEKGTYLDAEAAYDYLVRQLQIPPEEIIVFGRSLGGAVAIELAREKKAAGLICEATFTSAEEMGREIYPFLPVKLLISNKYDSISKVGTIPVPKLFVHSRQDELVPFVQGEKLFRAAAPPKEFLEIRGGHGDGFLETADRYRSFLNEFLQKYLPVRNNP